ncbi:MAG TPA: agmatine deiminase, partial [Rhodospirillales bacterium]|nr:agmatine deiminase [Rhodospirillales bacterium]
VMAARDEPGGPHHEALEANYEVLKQATDARGRSLEIIELPMPRPRERREGVLLTTSYVNFYIANGGIVMPAFDDAADKTAYRIVAAAFPEHEVVQVEVLDLVAGGGGIHCVTQQQPKA